MYVIRLYSYLYVMHRVYTSITVYSYLQYVLCHCRSKHKLNLIRKLLSDYQILYFIRIRSVFIVMQGSAAPMGQGGSHPRFLSHPQMDLTTSIVRSEKSENCPSTIPLIFHQTYKERQLPTQYMFSVSSIAQNNRIAYNNTLENMSNCEFFKYYFWTDESIKEL